MNVASITSHTLTRAGSIILGFTLLSAATACGADSSFDASFDPTGSGGDSSLSSETVSSAPESTTSPNAPSDVTSPSSPNPTTGAGTDASCGVDPQASEIYDHIAEVPLGTVDDMYWKYNGDSNYDPCADLSYASLDQMPQGDGQFARQLMLFHKGEYLGVGSDHSLQHIRIHHVTDDSLTVTYKDWEALARSGQPLAAAPNFTKDVTYMWDGDHVEMIGSVPN